MSSSGDKMEHAVREMLPQVVASLEDKLLAAVQAHLEASASASAAGASSPSSDPSASTATTPRAHAATTTEPQLVSSSAPEPVVLARAPPPVPTPTSGSSASIPFPEPGPAPHRSHASSPPPSSYTLGLPLSASPSSSMEDHRIGSGNSTLASSSQGRVPFPTPAPAPAPAPIPVPSSINDASAPAPSREAMVDDLPPATPAKERVTTLSPGEREVTDARMMPAPGPPDPRRMSHYDRGPISPTSPQPQSFPQPQPYPHYNYNGPPPPRPHSRRQSQVDWIVPTAVRPDPATRDTVQRRLGFTIDVAKKRHSSLERHAKLVGRALNAAIGLQVVVGALITGLAAVTTGRQTSIMTSILGALSTIIGAYLARMRGTGEPDLSKSRAKGWEKFLRSCEAYLVDHGEEPARNHMERITEFRQEFEDLEGSSNAEQKGNNV